MEIKEEEAESIRFEATIDVTLTVEYDPLLQTVSGVISSGCHEPGYAFFYRVDPSTAQLAGSTETWDGRVHFIDLETGEDLLQETNHYAQIFK